MRAFITGITGFAGSHLAEHLLAAGDEVRGCNRSGRWHEDVPPAVRDAAKLSRGDVADANFDVQMRDDWTQFQPEVIYHLAGLSIPGDCGEFQANEAARQTNVEGTRRVLALAASLIHRPRVVFASSAHVYGAAEADSPPVREDGPLAPRGGYGQSKLAAEQVCREFAARYSLEVVIARAFPHAGPRQDRRLMLASWCQQFAAGQDRPIDVQTLDAVIDLSDVRDVVRAYRLLAWHGSNGQVYNVGRGAACTSGQVLAILQQLTGDRRPVVQSRPGVKFDPIADLSRIKTDMGWQPLIPLEQTVADEWSEWQGKE